MKRFKKGTRRLTTLGHQDRIILTLQILWTRCNSRTPTLLLISKFPRMKSKEKTQISQKKTKEPPSEMKSKVSKWWVNLKLGREALRIS